MRERYCDNVKAQVVVIRNNGIHNRTTRLVAVLAVFAIHPALAAGDPDAARGIVAEYCTACHVVPGYRPRHERASINAPSFQSIANQPESYTRARLAAFLRQPHYPMKKFTLSPRDVENLIAFIESLRAENISK